MFNIPTEMLVLVDFAEEFICFSLQSCKFDVKSYTIAIGYKHLVHLLSQMTKWVAV